MRITWVPLVMVAALLTTSCNSAMPGSMGSTGNGGGSNPPPVGSPSISILSMSPDSVVAGSSDFTIVITGTGLPDAPAAFKNHPAVLWRGSGFPDGAYLVVNFLESDAKHVTV